MRMKLDLTPLFDRAFFTAEALRATPALAEAREQSNGKSWEIVVPADPDHAWLEETLLRKLVYFCETSRAPLPACKGVFVSFFAGDRLYCVEAAIVIAFACEALSVTSEELVRRYGTGEVRHALPHPPSNGKSA
jgi:hypothetical protein